MRIVAKILSVKVLPSREGDRGRMIAGAVFIRVLDLAGLGDPLDIRVEGTALPKGYDEAALLGRECDLDGVVYTNRASQGKVFTGFSISEKNFIVALDASVK